MTNNLNEDDIDIKEDSTNPEDENGPWIYKEPRPNSSVNYDRGLNDYCQRRVFCRTGYRANGCKTPIQCIPLSSGGKRSKRQSKRKRRTRRK